MPFLPPSREYSVMILYHDRTQRHRRHVVGDDQIGVLRFQLAAGVLCEMIRLRGKADDDPGALIRAMPARMSGVASSSLVMRPSPRFIFFVSGVTACNRPAAAIMSGGGARQVPRHCRVHLLGAAHGNKFNALGGSRRAGPLINTTRAPRRTAASASA